MFAIPAGIGLSYLLLLLYFLSLSLNQTESAGQRDLDGSEPQELAKITS